MKVRLDKYLAHAGIGTRKEVKQYIRKGYVTINDQIIKKDDYKIDDCVDVVCFDGDIISYERYIYLMLNKPAGYICATEDQTHPTVIDLIDGYYQYQLFPIGRLDKDTEGLLLLSNDGEFAHKLMSPKRNYVKIYYAKCKGTFTEENIKDFESGIMIDGNYQCKSAKLEIIKQDEFESEVYIHLYEGKFHQVKKMVASCNNEVLYLKRIQIKNLKLDPNLKLGEYRPLTSQEFIDLQKDL